MSLVISNATGGVGCASIWRVGARSSARTSERREIACKSRELECSRNITEIVVPGSSPDLEIANALEISACCMAAATSADQRRASSAAVSFLTSNAAHDSCWRDNTHGLHQHPEIFLSQVEEPYFFTR